MRNYRNCQQAYVVANRYLDWHSFTLYTRKYLPAWLMQPVKNYPKSTINTSQSLCIKFIKQYKCCVQLVFVKLSYWNSHRKRFKVFFVSHSNKQRLCGCDTRVNCCLQFFMQYEIKKIMTNFTRESVFQRKVLNKAFFYLNHNFSPNCIILLFEWFRLCFSLGISTDHTLLLNVLYLFPHRAHFSSTSDAYYMV